MRERGDLQGKILEAPFVGQRQYDLVILDVHGTMTSNVLRSMKAAHLTAQLVLGKKLPQDFYVHLLQRDPQIPLKEFFRSVNEIIPESEVERFKKEFDAQMEELYMPVPGIVDTVKKIEGLGAQTVVLTNGNNLPAIENALQQWGLHNLSSQVFGSQQMRVKKPHAKTLTFMAGHYEEQTGRAIDPERILIVGDYRGDIQTGINAGIDSVLFIAGTATEKEITITDPKPTYIIHDVRDLVQIVKGQREPHSAPTFSVPAVLWNPIRRGEQT